MMRFDIKPPPYRPSMVQEMKDKEFQALKEVLLINIKTLSRLKR